MRILSHFTKYRVLWDAQNFQLRYHIVRKPDFSDALLLGNTAVIGNPLHPLYQRCLEKYRQQASKLTIHVAPTKKHLSNKAFIRVNTSRRIKEATLQSLRQRGYKKDGSVDKPRDTNGVGIGERNLGKSMPLRGALMFVPYESAVAEDMTKLRAEVQACIDVFLSIHQKEVEARSTHEERMQKWEGAKLGHKAPGREVPRNVPTHDRAGNQGWPSERTRNRYPIRNESMGSRSPGQDGWANRFPPYQESQFRVQGHEARDPIRKGNAYTKEQRQPLSPTSSKQFLTRSVKQESTTIASSRPIISRITPSQTSPSPPHYHGPKKPPANRLPRSEGNFKK